jgi:hypothetical protein
VLAALRRAFRPLALGLAVLVSSLLLEQLGSRLQSLPVLVLSLALAIGGAVICFRGLLDLFGELA